MKEEPSIKPNPICRSCLIQLWFWITMIIIWIVIPSIIKGIGWILPG